MAGSGGVRKGREVKWKLYKEEEGRKKKTEEDRTMEIHRMREKKKGGNKERMSCEECVV